MCKVEERVEEFDEEDMRDYNQDVNYEAMTESMEKRERKVADYRSEGTSLIRQLDNWIWRSRDFSRDYGPGFVPSLAEKLRHMANIIEAANSPEIF